MLSSSTKDTVTTPVAREFEGEGEVKPAARSQFEGEERTSPFAVGKTYVNNIWYCAMAGADLKKGKMAKKVLLGEPLVIGRDQDGVPFALIDICPHQAVPLSDGHFDGREIECCFHGWKFDTKGICTEIPSLCADQKMNICKIKTRSKPCREVQGTIWVFFGDTDPANLPEVPEAPGLEGMSYDSTASTLLLPTHLDYAVAALIDTAHVPYVHKSWWWRSKKRMAEKQKTYVPSGSGWTMVKHSPSKSSLIFKLIGRYIETEISFRLPGCRREYLTFHGRTMLAGITMLTPIDETHTQLVHRTYWTVPYLAPLLTPVVNYFVKTFLGQDQSIALMQAKVLKYNPKLIMTIKDAGTPGHWYFLLKREWNEATAKGRKFVNPIKETVLRWRT